MPLPADFQLLVEYLWELIYYSYEIPSGIDDRVVHYTPDWTCGV